MSEFKNLTIENYEAEFIGSKPHLLLDVRTVEEYKHGHVPSAVNIPLDELQERVSEVPNDAPIIVICASGVRSLYGANFLSATGYAEVYNLEEGTKGWAARRKPLE